MKQQLTKDQSITLFDMGIPASSATGSFTEEPSGDTHSWTYPVFTIGDLLDFLPEAIETTNSIYALRIDVEDGIWNVCYSIMKESKSEELIDALFDITVWCI